jgi:hypothetical protein
LCKLFKLLVKDDLVGTPALVLGFGLVPETDIRGSLAGELIITAIALAAYETTTMLSLREGNSLRICSQIFSKISIRIAIREVRKNFYRKNEA